MMQSGSDHSWESWIQLSPTVCCSVLLISVRRWEAGLVPRIWGGRVGGDCSDHAVPTLLPGAGTLPLDQAAQMGEFRGFTGGAG